MSIQSVARLFVIKYSSPNTLRSNELGVKSPEINVDMYGESGPISVSPLNSNRFEEEDDFEPETFRREEEESLSPIKQKLVFILDKMNMNTLISPLYLNSTYKRIVDADDKDVMAIILEFKNHIRELEENAKYYQATIDDIKKYLNQLDS